MFWKRSARPLSVHYGACSHVGQVRSENQDAYGVFPEAAPGGDPVPCVFVVADGMGGHEDGGQASRVTVEIVGRLSLSEQEKPIEVHLARAISAANERVYTLAHGGPLPKKMGTTCSVLALIGGEAWVAHVGDSRVYRVNQNGRIAQLTQDHTLVGELQREGVLTEAEAERHPQRHALVRAVGVEPGVEVDVERVDPLQAGDRFVLCSDGLARVADEEIRDIVRGEAPQAAAERLVYLANERGGHDNVTVLVVEVR
ncbi:MAG: PP2C family serine/threonine-protein phosphatase [Bacteroidota bacterium]